MKKEERFKYYKHSMGLDAWHISPVKNNCKPLTLNDGPCGVRKPAINDFTNQNGVIEAVCCLAPSAIAASFSDEVAYRNGQILAIDCNKKGVDVLLAPGINIKRSCLCGRNFEYFSEDPFLAGYLAANCINGLQDGGVRACVKHYCCNNKELARKLCSSNLSLRALNELYLRTFSYVFEYSNPFSLMTSYNRVNGEYVAESDYLINKKLKKEFNFKGLIMSDWCAVYDKAKTIKTGIHVEMPLAYRSDAFMEKELLNGKFNEDDLLRNDEEFYNAVTSFASKPIQDKGFEELHQMCIQNANQVPVLVKNNNKYLPLKTKEKVLFIGYSVSNQEICGDGSASVNPISKETFLDVLIRNKANFEFLRGFDENDRVLTSVDELMNYSNKVDKVVLFLNVFKHDETENSDRETISIRKAQLEVFNMVKTVFKQFATVFICGSVYDIHEIFDKSEAMIINYFSGEGQHYAIYNNLYGIVNPSGRLPETWISSLKLNPLYERILKHDLYNEYYDEDIFVGYKYYIDNKNGFILPFGYGLSYSSFTYNNFGVFKKEESLMVSLDVKNVSNIKGSDVIQIYIGKKDSNIYRVKYELKGFKKVEINPNCSLNVQLEIPVKNLAVYNETNDTMEIENGTYQIYLCKNSFDVVDVKDIEVEGKQFKKCLKPVSISRREEKKEFSLLTPCEEFVAQGTSKIIDYLTKYDDVNVGRVVEIMSWNCGMTINELQWFGIISFDEILGLIDYFNQSEGI